MVERDTRFGGNLELANIGDVGIASLAKQQLDFDRSNREFARFHAKSDPTAQKWEQSRYELYNHPEFINARSPRVFRNTQWSPNYPGPKFDTRFIVGANKSSEGLRSWPSSDYYENMRERNKFHQSFKENEIRNMILGPNRIYSNESDVQAGIPATNQGYRVMNASDPTGNYGWLDRLRRWLFNDPYDKESDESLYQGTGQDKLEGGKSDPLEGALQGGMMGLPHEPNPWLADEYNEDLLEQEKMNKWIEDNNIGPEDLRMEPQLDVRSRGIESLDEYQMAELTQGQKDMMGNPLNTPDFGVSKQDLWGQVKDMEDKGFFGWGAQEPTTQEEYDNYYRQLQAGTVGNWVT